MKLFQLPVKNILIILFFFLIAACGNKESKDKKMERSGRQLDFAGEVSFLNKQGEAISTIKVAVADEPNERNQGLMDVTNLAFDEGMLFVFEEEDELSFYMANTPLPLDIMFVDSDSTIIRIHHSTTPFSDKQLTSDGPAQFVVETNGGYSIANDIHEGMKIRIEN